VFRLCHSSPHPGAVEIEARPGREQRRPALAEDLDLEPGAVLEIDWLHIAQRQALADMVAVTARRDPASARLRQIDSPPKQLWLAVRSKCRSCMASRVSGTSTSGRSHGFPVMLDRAPCESATPRRASSSSMSTVRLPMPSPPLARAGCPRSPVSLISPLPGS